MNDLKELSFVDDPGSLSHAVKLCTIDDPFSVSEKEDALFIEAIREIIDWHAERCDFYKTLLDVRGFSSEQLQSIDDCARIPPILADFFKTHEVLSIPKEAVHTHLTSSGTSGQKSQMFFDEWSRSVGLGMVDAMFRHYGFESPDQQVNYLLFSYELPPGSKLGTATTSHMLCKYAPSHKEFCAIRNTGDGGTEFDCFGCIRALQEYEADGLPVRIIGFPSFLYFTMERIKNLGLPKMKLHPDSLVFTAGGWKGFANRTIPKEELFAMVEEYLGIPQARCRDAYGSVEHSVPYIENERHHLCVPVWSRVFIRDVRTLEPLGYGEPGFLQFVAPYILSSPAHSVMMGDLAVMHPPEENGRPWFEILGRAGTSKNRSCAVAAAELMKR